MTSRERDLLFLNDLDGIHFYAPPPLHTMLQLLRKNFVLPETNKPIEEYIPDESWKGILSSKWSILFHQVRPYKREALAGLAEFQRVASDHERQLRTAVASGRDRDKHEMTRKRLTQAGHMRYFSDVYLNEGRSATSWKEYIARRFVAEGFNVLHIDDDLRAGLAVARVQEDYPDESRVLVYMMRNLSNHPALLHRAGLSTLPDNLVFVSSFAEAAHDFAIRLDTGKL